MESSNFVSIPYLHSLMPCMEIWDINTYRKKWLKKLKLLTSKPFSFFQNRWTILPTFQRTDSIFASLIVYSLLQFRSHFSNMMRACNCCNLGGCTLQRASFICLMWRFGIFSIWIVFSRPLQAWGQ